MIMPSIEPKPPEPQELLRRTRQAIRQRQLLRAQCLAEQYCQCAGLDAACLNLLGLIAESRGQWVKARQYWKKALRNDRHYWAAIQNLRRYYELSQFGRAECLVAFGDEPTDQST
jgi:tetratricopeptide (TPR) repeat protein